MSKERRCIKVLIVVSLFIMLYMLSSGMAWAQVNLINNGNFEAGFVPDGHCDLVEPDGDQLPVGWSCVETFTAGGPEPSLISQFPLNGPSMPGTSSVKFFRADQCHLSGDWTTIEQAINRDITNCQSLDFSIDVRLIPMAGAASHNLGGSGHVAGPCDPSGYEYPVTVKIDYTDAIGVQRCWQYGWYQFPTTQANRTDSGCVSPFDGQNANPPAGLSQQIGTNVWVTKSVNLLGTLPGVKTIDKIRVGGSGWSFDSAVDNLQMLCELRPCPQGPYPQCGGSCPTGLTCEPDSLSGTCLCVLPCAQSQFPACPGWCPVGQMCVAGIAGACECQALPCEQTYPMCNGPCPTGMICVAGTASACECQPLACEQTSPMCNGPCPAGQACRPGPLNSCECAVVPCEQSLWPQCGGPCPTGQACVADAIGACRCEVLPCEQTYPMCNGPCPAGQACGAGAAGACECQALPCEQTYPMCNGPCPTGQVCVADPFSAACVCQSTDGTTYKADWLDYAPSGMPDFEQLHQYLPQPPYPPVNPRTACGPAALLDSLWWFDSEMECDTHHTMGDGAETEPNDTCPAADSLGEAPPIPAALALPPDKDWYAFEVPEGGTRQCSIVLSTYALAAAGDADTKLSLYDSCAGGSPGGLIAQNDDAWGSLQSEISAWTGPGFTLKPGTHYVLVEVGHSGAAGHYTLSLGLDCYPLIQRWTQKAPDDHSPYNVEQLIASLWTCANTDDLAGGGRWKGTTLHDMKTCADEWQNAMGIGSKFTRGVALAPSFEEVAREVKKSEDVVLLLGFYWQAGIAQWIRCGGHYVTVAGVDPANGTITVSDPYFNNAEPPPAGSGGPGRVRGPDHTDHAPGVTPPPDHDDAQNVSHDRYTSGPSTVVPPVSQWSLQGYATNAGGFMTCRDVVIFCAGSDSGQNPRDYPSFQEPCPDLGIPVTAEVEAMVDVSPIQTPVCVYLDPVSIWPENLRVLKGACEPPQQTLEGYDLIRGKRCSLEFSPFGFQVDLGHVQCLYNDAHQDQFEDLSPDDESCFGPWLYLIRRSTDAEYGSAHPGGEHELPSSGGCP